MLLVLDHPIFSASIALIRRELANRAARDPGFTSWLEGLGALERDVLERCIHSSGDLTLAADLVFDPLAAAAPATDACSQGLAALQAGAPILCDTAMAAAAVAPMARRTLGNRVACLLDWAPAQAPASSTRSAAAVEPAWTALASASSAAAEAKPVVLIGSAPTALERLLDLVAAGAPPPSLLIGMPVGFIGVAESKRRLAASGLAQIRLDGPRGGAGLVGAACNALLRAAALGRHVV
ncbi:MAG: precorrin-8X methylmutase [Cyanobacteriota bacterium]|nr:precorrin-8X methylmutase [Cyanobacteriota bacterium]